MEGILALMTDIDGVDVLADSTRFKNGINSLTDNGCGASNT